MSRILLLEDDLSIISGLSFALKKQGFEIEIARTIKEAGECWRKRRYHLLILDVSLPDGSGFDFCQTVRKESEVPIIFLTASDEEMNIIMVKEIGDTVSLVTPAGSFEYVISGIAKDGTLLQRNDASGVFVSMESFEKIAEKNGKEVQPVYYIQFGNTWTIRKTIDKLKAEHGWDKEVVAENAAILGILGMSSSSYVVGLYGVAIALVILVMLAGVLMIAGSMNSNIADRTQYFGILRCIGTSKAQIKHIVRLEALNWCKKAIPVGILIASLASWGICAILRFVIGGEWENMPVFKLSPIGIISGTVIGIITVLIAANAPAKRAAKVTPVAGILGNTENRNTKRAANTKFFKVENALGIHHAFSQKKSLMMMTGSFALSMINMP